MDTLQITVYCPPMFIYAQGDPMKRLSAVLMAVMAIGCLSVAARAQEVPLEVKGGDVKVVKVDKVIVVKQDLTVVASFPFTVQAPTGAGLYFWSYPGGVQASDQGDKLAVANAPKGSLTISVKLISAKLDKDGRFVGFATQFGSVTFSIGDVPPSPEPGPKPPEPPTPSLPVSSLRVLIVYDDAKLKDLPPAQLDAIFADEVRSYLSAKCVKGVDGKADWRMWKSADDPSKEPLLWRDAFARPRKSLPWMLVADGSKVDFANPIYDGPLPASVAEMMTLLRKLGG